jgi:DNA invertase Pin-like site-specific DNA recombinase
MMVTRKPAKPVVFAYVRWSSDQQESGDSERRQVEGAKEYAKRHSLELLPENIIIDPGLSAWDGSNVSRGKLGKLLKDAEAGKLPRGSIIITEQSDRLSRQGIDGYRDIIRTFTKAGIEVHITKTGMVYTPKATGLVDAIMSDVHSYLDKEESDKKAGRVADAWAKKRANASTKPLTAKCPAWLKLVDGKFQVIKDRAKIVKEIFEASAAGIGTLTITRDLNARKEPPFGKPPKKRPTTGWHESYVQKILVNRAAIGQFQPHREVDGKRVPDGEPIPGYFPAVVTEDLFLRAKRGRERRQNGGGRKGENISNLFSGIACCAYCGSKMSYRNKSIGKRSYLQCMNALRGLGCERTGWPYPDFQASFIRWVKELDIPAILNADKHAQARTTIQNEIEALEAKITDIEEKIETMLDMATKTTSERVAKRLEEYERQLTDVKAMLEKKQQECDSLKREPTELNDFQAIMAKLESKDEDAYKLRSQVQAKLQSLVSKIYVASVGSAPLLEKAKEEYSAEEINDDDFDDEMEERDVDLTKVDPSDPGVHIRYFQVRFIDEVIRIQTVAEGKGRALVFLELDD